MKKTQNILLCNTTAPSTEKLLRWHGASYPKMEVRDAVKLLYQGAFGPGHALSDEKAVLARMLREIASLPQSNAAPAFPIEEIGGGYVRLRLTHGGESESELQSRAVLFTRLFMLSAKQEGVPAHTFAHSLEVLRHLTSQGIFSFDSAELEAYVSAYIAAGLPAVSHSETYRAAYCPAYRVIKRDYAPLLPLLRETQDLLQQNRPLCLLIDGMCGSGKSTLASLLHELFSARTIHMDHFFLPPERRTAEQLTEPGGNVDYERFHTQVAEHLTDESLTYDVFDCSVMANTSRRTLNRGPLTIIEGSYACHPAFCIPAEYKTLRIYMECDADRQKSRLLARNGKTLLNRFLTEWIPMEQQYDRVFGIREQADYIIKT